MADGASVEEAAEALTGAQVQPRLQAKMAASGATILDEKVKVIVPAAKAVKMA